MDNKMRRYFQFLLVVLAAGSIYPMIYLRNSYQETILYVFGLDIQQLNNIYTALGFTFVVGYFPSGWISDKFSAKWLLAASLFATSMGGFWFAQIPDANSVVAIFVIWGIFSVFTFWSAHMKVVKLLSTKEEEGRFFGILDGGRGLIEAILAAIALFIFSNIVGDNGSTTSSREALQGVIYMYSGVLLVVSVLIAIFVDDIKETAPTKEKIKADKAELATVFKNKLVYLLGAIIFMGYTVTWGQFFISGHMEVNLGFSAVSAATLMVAFLWTRPVGGMLGGYLADRLNKELIVGLSTLIASVCFILLAILPSYLPEAVWWAIVLTAGLSLFCIRGTYWSLLGNLKISNKVIGLAIGYVSFWGYLPDVIAPQMSNFAFGNFGDNGGFNAYFIITGALGIIGVLLCFVFRKMTKEN